MFPRWQPVLRSCLTLCASWKVYLILSSLSFVIRVSLLHLKPSLPLYGLLSLQCFTAIIKFPSIKGDFERGQNNSDILHKDASWRQQANFTCCLHLASQKHQSGSVRSNLPRSPRVVDRREWHCRSLWIPETHLSSGKGTAWSVQG